ncbi:hypothetical protein I2486_03370 [Cellulophaga sp. E16_2]|uniref:hypothetical protein n=1 Tax=unclassified Cellulophaga TaxID=2634405 RepID=UPI0013FD7D67|nr:MULTISPECIES: hypothetical protein [unclassified Cellulophaga]MBO0590438.1 hypothetical protein [Cellulophaga sp. E16_2]
MKKIIKYLFLPLLFLFVITACSDEQNFDQARDLDVITDATGPILYFESTEALINSSPIITQNVNFDGFSSELFSDRVISGSLTFQIENTTSKQLEIRLEFLNEAGDPVDVEVFSVDAAPPAVIVDREVFYGPATGKSIDIIKSTSSLRMIFTNNSGSTSVSSLPDPKLIFRSSASFKLRVIE